MQEFKHIKIEAQRYLKEKDTLVQDYTMQNIKNDDDVKAWETKIKKNEDRLRAAFWLDTFEFNSLEACMHVDVNFIIGFSRIA